MGIVSIAPAGEIGLVKDLNPAEIPPNAWTDGINVHFRDRMAVAGKGDVPLGPATPVQFYYGIPTQDASFQTALWVMFGLDKAYSYVGGAYTEVTRVSGDYGGTAANRWTGGALNGVLIANNGVDPPQLWSPIFYSTKLVNLPNWPANTSARAVRPFKNYLVALDVFKGSTRYPTMVKWSHPADPGQPPASWDETDPTKDAGEYPLSETFGYCIDAVPLRDILLIYKQDSVWGMQYIGGAYVFRFYKLFGNFGIPSQDCAVEFAQGQHLAYTGDDIVRHDGQNYRSVVHGRLRRVIANIADAQIKASYMAVHALEKEVWFCFQRNSGPTLAADTALVYNWESETCALRELNSYTYMQLGRIDPPQPQELTWNTQSMAWDTREAEWGETAPSPSAQYLVGFGPDQLYWLDSSNGPTLPTKLEKTYFGVPVQANKPPDLSAVKFLTRIWPRFIAEQGTPMQITLGSAMSVAEPIQWKSPQQFLVGVDTKIDCTLSGKLFAIRFEGINAGPWTYDGMDADIILAGQN